MKALILCLFCALAGVNLSFRLPVKAISPRVQSAVRKAIPIELGVDMMSHHSGLPLAGLDELSVQLYNAQLGFSGLIERELTSLTPLSLALLYGAGLLTALSPCSVSLLPLTLAYLGSGTDGIDEQGLGGVEKSAYYAAGFSAALTMLALIAVLGGQLFGYAFSSTGIPPDATSMFTALLTAIMGLSVLEIVTIKFPSFSTSSLLDGNQTSERLQPLFLGASAAFISSPCASPVLASLLTILASNSNTLGPALGLILLLTYSAGYTTPILFAGALSEKINAVSRKNGFQWVNFLLGISLVAFGTYNFLDSSFKTLYYVTA